MELYQIRYFVALCDTLNFARAAERCNVSQPSLSRAVQKLEQELGALLIHRERRLTHLTELGELWSLCSGNFCRTLSASRLPPSGS